MFVNMCWGLQKAEFLDGRLIKQGEGGMGAWDLLVDGKMVSSASETLLVKFILLSRVNMEHQEFAGALETRENL